MLKFFRKYNKILLAVFGTGLMIIFLIEPAMRGCGAVRGPLDYGTLASGEVVTGEHQQQAAAQMRVLGALATVGGPEAPPHWPFLIAAQGADAWQWMLSSMAAREMGLSAGSQEIEVVLNMLAVTEQDVATVSRRLGVSRDFVRASVGEWLMIDRFRGLVYGMAPLSVAERVDRYNQLGQVLLRGYGDMTLPLGEPYLSDRVIQYFLHALRSEVRVSMIIVPYSENSEMVEEPTEETVRALFERHKGDKTGEGKPHGFGYLVPDQVKLEHVSLSIEAVEAKLELTERESLDFHAKNRDLFTRAEMTSALDVTDTVTGGADPVATLEGLDPATDTTQTSTTRQLTYAEARDEVRRQALRQKAEARAD